MFSLFYLLNGDVLRYVPFLRLVTEMEIIRGTTPTVIYKFKCVNPADLSAAFLTIKQDGETLLDLDINAATIGEDNISWVLSQQNTLQMSEGKVTMMMNWKLNSGRRGASKENTVIVKDNYKDVVI